MDKHTVDCAVPVRTVAVRWWDGYLERFTCEYVRFGSDLLFLLWQDERGAEHNRHIPLRHVRWFSVSPTSRE